MREVLEQLKRYVAVRSLSKDESALAEIVIQDLRELGLQVRRSGNNVWCEIGDVPRPRLLLNSHMDTVPAGEGWSRDPWTPALIDDRLYGLGANDAKGCVVSMMNAVRAWAARVHRGEKLGGTIVLALTAEEENSGAGLSTILEQLRPVDAALVGEPTDLVPMIAQRGLLILRCMARGRTSHPANTPATDTNAIHRAARAIAKIESFDWGPPHPQLGRAHAHVTEMRGGVARNVVPDLCEFTIDIRTTPMERHEALHARLANALAPCEVHVHSQRLTPIETPADHAIVRAIGRALPAALPAGSPAMSDMVFLSGIPAVKIGPGHSPRSHTPDEYIRVDELRAGVAAYEAIIREYFALHALDSGGRL